MNPLRELLESLYNREKSLSSADVQQLAASFNQLASVSAKFAAKKEMSVFLKTIADPAQRYNAIETLAHGGVPVLLKGPDLFEVTKRLIAKGDKAALTTLLRDNPQDSFLPRSADPSIPFDSVSELVKIMFADSPDVIATINNFIKHDIYKINEPLAEADDMPPDVVPPLVRARSVFEHSADEGLSPKYIEILVLADQAIEQRLISAGSQDERNYLCDVRTGILAQIKEITNKNAQEIEVIASGVEEISESFLMQMAHEENRVKAFKAGPLFGEEDSAGIAPEVMKIAQRIFLFSPEADDKFLATEAKKREFKAEFIRLLNSLYKNPDLQPILQIIVKEIESNPRFNIVLLDDKTVDLFAPFFRGARGYYNNFNSITACLGDETPKIMGRLIHEFTHITQQRIFGNVTNPYIDGDRETPKKMGEATRECLKKIAGLLNMQWPETYNKMHPIELLSRMYYLYLHPLGPDADVFLQGRMSKLEELLQMNVPSKVRALQSDPNYAGKPFISKLAGLDPETKKVVESLEDVILTMGLYDKSQLDLESVVRYPQMLGEGLQIDKPVRGDVVSTKLADAMTALRDFHRAWTVPAAKAFIQGGCHQLQAATIKQRVAEQLARIDEPAAAAVDAPAAASVVDASAASGVADAAPPVAHREILAVPAQKPVMSEENARVLLEKMTEAIDKFSKERPVVVSPDKPQQP